MSAGAAMGALARFGSRLSHRAAMHLPVAPFPMRGGAGLVSLTFDDVPASALTVGAPLLESFGARGTFYVASGLVGTRGALWPLIEAEGVAALHRAGHEIGLHTDAHRSFAALPGREVEAEIGRNRDALRAIAPGLALDNFAYPYGVASLAGKHRLGRLARSSRGIAEGINHGRIDLQFLRAVPLYDRLLGRAEVERWLDRALASGGWLIFYTHDVAASPSPYGCSPGLLRAALDGAARRGLAVASVADALDRIGAARHR